MKKQILSVAIALLSLNAFSQKVIDVTNGDVNAINGSLLMTAGGLPLGNVKYSKVIAGSPYFTEKWMKSDLTLSGGTTYKNLFIRLDLVDNSFQYTDKQGTTMVSTTAARRIVLNDTITHDSYTFDFATYTPALQKGAIGWYQLLAEGHTSLYNRITKEVDEERPYGSATYEQTIRTTNNYLIASGAMLTPVKKVSDVPDILSDKKTELSAYISSNHIAGKSIDDITRVVEYYNSLFK